MVLLAVVALLWRRRRLARCGKRVLSGIGNGSSCSLNVTDSETLRYSQGPCRWAAQSWV